MVALVHFTLPIVVVMLAAGLSHIDQNLERAATSLGVDRIRVFFTVTLPLSIPGIVAATSTAFASTFSAFATPQMIGGGQVQTISTLVYPVGFASFNFPLAASLSLVGLAFTRRVPRAEVDRRVRDTLELVKLSDFANRRPRQLSGGQQQRVALARALVIRPRVLLLDEPFSALDRNLRTAMQVELKEIQSRLGLTTVFVTHDQSEALSMSDRIAVMSRGRIRQIGTPAEIYDRPQDQFISTFVGDANLFSATLLARERGTARLTIGETALEVRTFQDTLPEPGPVSLFVRPEQCRLTDADQIGTVAARVALSVYQGSHTEVHLDCADAEGGRVMLRLPASTAPKPGTRVGIALPQEGPAIYAREEQGEVA